MKIHIHMSHQSYKKNHQRYMVYHFVRQERVTCLSYSSYMLELHSWMTKSNEMLRSPNKKKILKDCST